VILQEAVIGKECLIAAGAVVLEKARIPDRSLVAGVPGKIRRTLEPSTPSTEEWLSRSWRHYHALSRQYLEEGVGDR
jgi:carbonic anhydrase/acetyltransferase-like protein (isoleucine patch superfamily)